MKKILLLLLIVGSGFLAYFRTDGFSPASCQPIVGVCEVEPAHFPCPTRFVYLDRGKQAFVFESEDKKIVLKLFDRRHLEGPWYSKIPGIFLERKKRSAERVHIFPQSYRLAFDFFAKETGLLSVHLGRSSTVWPTVQLTDKASRQFQINLNEVAFVLQEKGEGTLLDKLEEAKHNEPLLKELLEQYFTLHAKRIHQSIADRDRDIEKNYAWKNGKLLYIDPARFFHEEKLQDPARLKHEWWSCTYRLRRWVEKNSPEVLGWYDGRVAQNEKESYTQ